MNRITQLVAEQQKLEMYYKMSMQVDPDIDHNRVAQKIRQQWKRLCDYMDKYMLTEIFEQELEDKSVMRTVRAHWKH